MVQWAAEQKASRVSLDVTEGNLHATNLYLRHGFVEMGRLAPHPSEETLEYRFVKKLASSEAS